MKQNPYHLLFLHHTGLFSGAENSLLHLSTRLDSRIFKPIFLCPSTGDFPDRLRDHHIQVIHHDFTKVSRVFHVAKSVTRIARTVHTFGIKLVHSNGPQTNIPAGIAGRLSGVPVIWHARNLLKPGMIDIDKIAGLLPRRILCNSDAIKARFAGGITGNKSVTIINGVDLLDYDTSIPSYSIREEFGIPSGAKVVGMTSRLGSDKGHLITLQALARLKDRHPELWGLFVGGNIFEEDAGVPDFLKKKAEEFGIADRIVFTGFRKDVSRLYAGMDIFVLGTDAEPCGRTILEAMAMAKPVIGTDSGGTPEIVAHGETGFLFRYGDFEGLARAIAHLLETPYLISHMGKAGRARIEHQFTIEQYVDKTQREYLSLIEGTPC
jgi:glycosyltransferase involved in cell wall biosynthesis